MSRGMPSSPHALSAALGVVMVAATEPGTHWPALSASGLALGAVILGLRFRSASTCAVLLTALTLVFSAPPPILGVLSGLCAAAYLVTRHLSATNCTPTRATIVAALSFSLVGAAVAVIPSDVPWLPLIAPFGILAAYSLAVHPFLREPTRS